MNELGDFPLDYLSPSQINDGRKCPFSWASHRSHAPGIVTDMRYADVGTLVHRAIARYYEVISDRPHKGVIEGTFDGILNEMWKFNDYTLENRKRSALKTFVSFEHGRSQKWKQYKPTMVEQYLRASVNGITYNTVVDAFWEEDGVIVDWKTGAKNMLNEDDFVQGHVMRMVVRALGFVVNKVIFVCLTSGMYLELPDIKDSFVEDFVHELVGHWKRGVFPRRKGPTCAWCDQRIRCDLMGRRTCLWRE